MRPLLSVAVGSAPTCSKKSTFAKLLVSAAFIRAVTPPIDCIFTKTFTDSGYTSFGSFFLVSFSCLYLTNYVKKWRPVELPADAVMCKAVRPNLSVIKM